MRNETTCWTGSSGESGGGLLVDPLATGRPDSAAPLFLEEPQDAFVVKNKPATLSCRAAHALQLHFVCNDEDVHSKHHSQHQFVDPMTGINYHPLLPLLPPHIFVACD